MDTGQVNVNFKFILFYLNKMHKGFADLPLHYGRAPRWLFNRMVKLAGAISEAIVEYGTATLLEKISDPFWFQAFGCVLGFDWHSSGLTTTVCGALKIALKDANLGIAVCGGKGKTSLKTPEEILNSDLGLSMQKLENLAYASRISAKVDNACIQDGFQLYHHCFIFDERGNWAVIQQGMNDSLHKARRYHWFSEDIEGSMVDEPHSAICCDIKLNKVLDMTSSKSEEVRKCSVAIAQEFERELKNLKIKKLVMPRHHELYEFHLSKYGRAILEKIKTIEPKGYEELIAIKGVGPKTIRALALISELIYGKAPSYRDPAVYSFAHGGKDGWPYPVDKKGYDESIYTLRRAIEEARLGKREKLKMLKLFDSTMQISP